MIVGKNFSAGWYFTCQGWYSLREQRNFQRGKNFPEAQPLVYNDDPSGRVIEKMSMPLSVSRHVYTRVRVRSRAASLFLSPLLCRPHVTFLHDSRPSAKTHTRTRLLTLVFQWKATRASTSIPNTPSMHHYMDALPQERHKHRREGFLSFNWQRGGKGGREGEKWEDMRMTVQILPENCFSHSHRVVNQIFHSFFQI